MPPVRTLKKIPFARPDLGDEEAKLVYRLVRQGKFTSSSYEGGEFARRFERMLSRTLGCRHVVSVNSGTSALMASLLALNLPRGSEVIIPSFTFAATANAVLVSGARPVFCDVDPESLCISVEDVRRKMTRRTKAIVPVHLYGSVCDMDGLAKIGGEVGLHLIEDAAQALGSRWGSKCTGTIGVMGCFSFYPSKLVTSGEGGAVSTDDDTLLLKLKLLRNQGIGKDSTVHGVGLNLRLPEVLAAIGAKQMENFDRILKDRKDLARRYDRKFSQVDGLSVVDHSEGDSARTVYTIRVKKGRNKLLNFLLARGIEAKVFYRRPLHLEKYYRDSGLARERLAVSEQASREVLSLPLFSRMSREDQDFVVQSVVEGLSRIRDL